MGKVENCVLTENDKIGNVCVILAVAPNLLKTAHPELAKCTKKYLLQPFLLA